MTRKQALKHSSPRRSLSHPSHIPYALSPVACIVASAVMFGSLAAHAADEAVAPAAAASAPAAAASEPAADTQQARDLDLVVVRSRNRIEKLQDVPLSVSVVTGAELARTNAFDIGAITRRAANVSWNLGNQRSSSSV